MTATDESQTEGGDDHAGPEGKADEKEADQGQDADRQRDKTEGRQSRTDERQARAEARGKATEQQLNVVAHSTERALHLGEDVIYALTALLLVGGALVVLGEAVWEFATTVPDGVTKAIEAAMASLLIVFILVELLAAVRSAILEHRLVAEPFLLVGILAAIKEIVVLSTFKIESAKATEIMLKIGGLGGVVLVLGIATLLLRRKEREPDEG